MQSIALKMKDELESQYKNLKALNSWAILVGYDGGRKSTSRFANVNDYIPGMFQQIDRMPMRRREIKEQQQAGISCELALTSGA